MTTKSIKPSNVKRPMHMSIWVDRHKEIMAEKLAAMSRDQHNDTWQRFTLQDIERFCKATLYGSDKKILEYFCANGFLEKEGEIYSFTDKMIQEYAKYC